MPPPPLAPAAPAHLVPPATELAARCQALPAPPGLLLQIVRQADDEQTSAADLARTIGGDPTLASKLVRMANSSLFNPAKPITTIERTVAMLGLRSVKLLALSLSVDALLPGVHGTGPGVAEVRRRSLVNAVLSRRFAPAGPPGLADEAFLAGLVGHLGRLAVAHAAPEAFADLLARGGGWSRSGDERELLGVSGDELAAQLLAHWGLPQRLAAAIARRDPAAGPPPAELAPLVGALRLGLLAEEVLCGPDPAPALRQLRDDAQRQLGLPAGLVGAVLVEVEPVLAELGELLRLDLPAGTSHEELVARAMASMATLGADAAAELSEGRRRTAELASENRRLVTQTRLDRLTGLANRGTFDDALGHHLAQRAAAPGRDALGLLLIDLDRFKPINDRHGHTVGDAVLRAVGELLGRITRRHELAARYGGEEFALLLPHTTVGELGQAAERIRRELADLRIATRVGTLRITASIGGACTSAASGPQGADALIDRADAQLYEAKRAGRDRCRVDRSTG